MITGDVPTTPEPQTRENPLWAILASGAALLGLGLQVYRPDLLQHFPEAPAPHFLIGAFGTVCCVLAARASWVRAVPGILLNLTYWALVVAWLVS